MKWTKVASISWIRSDFFFLSVGRWQSIWEVKKKESNSNLLPIKSSSSKIVVRHCNYELGKEVNCFSHIIENLLPHN